MFQIYRKELASQLSSRFALDTTPSRHVLLALMMNPFVDTSAEGSQFSGKVAKWEMMQAEYRRALRRQAVHRRRPHMQPPQQQPCNASAQYVATPSQQMPPPQNDSYVSVTRPAAAIHEDSANINPPAGKRRKGLMGAVASLGGGAAMATVDREDGALDLEVKLEMERFGAISLKTLATGKTSSYYHRGADRFNLRSFWADHKAALPLHYSAYLAEVGCKKSASANVESVFSGAGNFMEQGGTSGSTLLERMVKLHYNWKYEFVRPILEAVVDRYHEKFKANPMFVAEASAAAPASASNYDAEEPADDVMTHE